MRQPPHATSTQGRQGPKTQPTAARDNSVRDWAAYDDRGTSTLADDTVTIVKHVVYDAFGNVIDDTAPGVESLLLYTARPFDAETHLQNNLNRWYDATIGRWLSVDPIGFAAGDANLYRYVGNSATWAVDPSGLAVLQSPSVVDEYSQEASLGIKIGRILYNRLSNALGLLSGLPDRTYQLEDKYGQWANTVARKSVNVYGTKKSLMGSYTRIVNNVAIGAKIWVVDPVTQEIEQGQFASARNTKSLRSRPWWDSLPGTQ